MYKIVKFKRYYLIANTQGCYCNHTHIKKYSKTGNKEYDSCLTLIRLVERKQIPKNEYFVRSAIRLTLDEEYKKALEGALIRRKSNKYINRR